MIDSLVAPLATTYPLRDLPVRVQNQVVMYNNKGKIIISFIEPDTTYLVYDESGADMGATYKTNNDEMTIETKPLVKEDYTFNVVAIKNISDKGGLLLRKTLLQTVIIKVGVDEEIPFTIDPEFVSYNQPVTLHLTETQSGAIYQVFDMKDQLLSDGADSGIGGDLAITTYPLKEDTRVKIKVTNKKTKQTGFLVNKPLIQVYPDDSLVPVLLDAENGIDFTTAATLRLDGIQSTADYQLIFLDIDDDTVDKPSFVNTTTGKTVKGSGTSIQLKTDKLGEDPTVTVAVTKRDSGLTRTLKASVFIPVKPDPGKKLSIVEASVKQGESATIKVNKPQRGIYYQLVTEDLKEVGWRVYYHKNYGLAKARIGIELAIGVKPDDTVLLATGPLNQDTVFNVIARKATTGKMVGLVDSIAVKLS